MSFCKHSVQGLCFSCIFEKRPDLEAPFFKEVSEEVALLHRKQPNKEDSTNEPAKNDKRL